MPMMMDDDLDDLFGDPPPLQLPPPLSKGLLQCVDELRLGGCCQKIAWSRFGCIACITPDGNNVTLQHLLCNPSDGQWKLSSEYVADEISAVHSEHHLVHLSWNYAGNDLAVIDIFGQISVFTVLITINRLTVSRRCIRDPEDNLSSVIGFAWLNTERMLPLYRPAVKKDNKWNFVASQHKLMGPHNPSSNKSALVAITRGGTIRLLLQGQDMRWQDAKAELDSVSISSELLTHASMCADKDSTMLLVTHSEDKQLRLYRMNFDFSHMTFNIQHIKAINHCSPLEQDRKELSTFRDASLQMSHLVLVPPGPETRNREPKHPFILVVFSRILDQYYDEGARDEPRSILSRWEFHSTETMLHPSFEQLTSKKPGASYSGDLPLEASLERLDDVPNARLVLSVQELSLGTVLALQYSDGMIEFRDRTSLEVLPRDDVTTQVSSLSQVGFDFPDEGPCLHSALSPNYCAVVSLSARHELKIRLMQISTGGFDEQADQSIIRAATEAFVLQFSIACTSHGNYNDDLLAMMQLFINQHSNVLARQGLTKTSVEETFLIEIYRVLGVHIDHSVDPQLDHLFKNQMIQRCLSMQLSLGYQGESKHRSLPAKVAWAILNIRFAALIFAWAFKRPVGAPGPESDPKTIDVIQSLLGLSSWLVGLMNLIVDDLFTLANDVKDHGMMDQAFLNSKVRSMNTPALSLILVSSSRLFLKYICRFFRNLTKELENNQNLGSRRQSFRELEAIFEAYPVTILQFDRIVSEADVRIKNAYQSAQTSDLDRKNIENEMLVSAVVPDVLMPALETFLITTLDALREEINEAELFFTDVSWLGLSDDRKSDAWKKDHVLDATRKVELRKNVPTRRCTRCCSMMEDVSPPRGTNLGVMTLHRTCFCGNWWMAVDARDGA